MCCFFAVYETDSKMRDVELDPDDPYQEKVAQISETVSKWHKQYLSSFSGSIFLHARISNRNN